MGRRGLFQKGGAEMATNVKAEIYNLAKILQHLAYKVVVKGEVLTPEENNQRVQALTGLWALGSSCSLTARDMVAIVYKWLPKVVEQAEQLGRCGCPSCEAKAKNK